MKVLTIFASIFIPLTFIAGVYGTNFEYIPELSFRPSYFIMWGVMIVVAVLMLLYFRKKQVVMKFNLWLRKRVKSFDFAIQGIVTLFTTQVNALIHLVATILVVAFGIIFQLSRTEWILVVLCIVMVIAAEAFNSSIEFLPITLQKKNIRPSKK